MHTCRNWRARLSYLSFQICRRRDHGCRANTHPPYRSATGNLPARLSGRVEHKTGHTCPGRALLPHDARIVSQYRALGRVQRSTKAAAS